MFSYNLNEHRAPTDDSIRILNEMQDKAVKNIVDNILIDDNDLKGSVIIYRDPLMMGFKIFVRFRLNGKPYKFEERINTYDSNLFNAKEKLAECMTKAIYKNLIKGLRESEHGGFLNTDI
jgi:hypothetical protein